MAYRGIPLAPPMHCTPCTLTKLSEPYVHQGCTTMHSWIFGWAFTNLTTRLVNSNSWKWSRSLSIHSQCLTPRSQRPCPLPISINRRVAGLQSSLDHLLNLLHPLKSEKSLSSSLLLLCSCKTLWERDRIITRHCICWLHLGGTSDCEAWAFLLLLVFATTYTVGASVIGSTPNQEIVKRELDPALQSAKGDTLVNCSWLEGGLVRLILATPKVMGSSLWCLLVRESSPHKTRHNGN